MADPPASLGYWTDKTARLAVAGEVKFSSEGAPQSVSDVWRFWVASKAAAAAHLDLTAIAGLPQPGDSHPTYTDLQVVGYSLAEYEPGRNFRDVTVEYEFPGEADDEGGGGGSTEEIGKITALDFPLYTQSGDLVADVETGAPVLNSAGDVFDSVPQVEQIFTGVHFVRRMKKSPRELLPLSGTVNSADVKAFGITFPMRTARLRLVARRMFDGSRRPWELDVTIEPRHNLVDSTCAFLPSGAESGRPAVAGVGYDFGWDVALLECGYQYRDATTGRKFRFTVVGDDNTQTAPQLPQLLKGDGDSNQDGQYPKAILIVKTAKGGSWSDLKIPQDEYDPADQPTPPTNPATP